MSRGKIGLIAGFGSLPAEFLKRAEKAGEQVVIILIKGEDNPRLKSFGYPVYTVKITSLTGILKIFKAENVKKAIMLGYVRHTNIFKNIKFDVKTLKILMRAGNMTAGSLLKEVIREFEKENIKVIPSTYLLDDIIASPGAAGRKSPGKKELERIKTGFRTASTLANLDVGQTVVVKNGVITAVEAQEGTDSCIKRGAEIGGKGFIVVKAARPRQDFRFDVPVIGPGTIVLIKKLGGKGIAVEAGAAIFVEKEKIIKMADRAGIFIYGIISGRKK